MNVKPIIPASATHPGKLLKKELSARGIVLQDFALDLGLTMSSLKELLKGKIDITESLASKLENILGIPARNWMNMQARYHYVQKCREHNAEDPTHNSQELSPLPAGLSLPFLYKA